MVATLLSGGSQDVVGLTVCCGDGGQGIELPKNPVLAALVMMERFIGAVWSSVHSAASRPSPCVFSKRAGCMPHVTPAVGPVGQVLCGLCRHS